MKQISFKELKQALLQDQMNFYSKYGERDAISNLKKEFKSISNTEGLINHLCEWGYDLLGAYDCLLSIIVKAPRKTINPKSRRKNTKQRSKK